MNIRTIIPPADPNEVKVYYRQPEPRPSIGAAEPPPRIQHEYVLATSPKGETEEVDIRIVETLCRTFGYRITDPSTADRLEKLGWIRTDERK